MKFKY
jgi:photosystem II stability/assembly factor-like uncharacterized protein